MYFVLFVEEECVILNTILFLVLEMTHTFFFFCSETFNLSNMTVKIFIKIRIICKFNKYKFKKISK